MERLKQNMALLCGVCLGVGLLLTNPGREEYLNYLLSYTSRNCENAWCDLSFAFWDKNIERMADRKTRRYNLFLFSVYTTKYGEIDELIVVGALGNFFMVSDGGMEY